MVGSIWGLSKSTNDLCNKINAQYANKNANGIDGSIFGAGSIGGSYSGGMGSIFDLADRVNKFTRSLNMNYSRGVSGTNGVNGTSNNFFSSVSGSGVGVQAINIGQQYLGMTGSQMSGNLNGYHAGVWCADFVSTMFAKANGGTPPWGSHMAAVAGIRDWGAQTGRLTTNKSPGNVKPGDVIIFGSGGSSHIGIVREVKNGRVYTLEGNSSDQVANRDYDLNSGYVYGFVKMS